MRAVGVGHGNSANVLLALGQAILQVIPLELHSSLISLAESLQEPCSIT